VLSAMRDVYGGPPWLPIQLRLALWQRHGCLVLDLQASRSTKDWRDAANCRIH
jgi:hypothetical protein